jgi:leucyl-tRNA synthetase
MEFLNTWENKKLSTEHAKQFLQILAPFAPFITEQIWREAFGEKQSIHLSSWPKVEERIVEEEIIIPVQVNGKLRATIKAQTITLKDQNNIKEEALKQEKVKKHLQGKKYNVIYVEGKILNFVIE